MIVTMAKGPNELTASLQRFGLERDRMRAAVARAVGIGSTDLDALEHLEADGPLTQRDLGERLSLTSGAITMLVDRLEQVGWVLRRPHPSDRRYVVIELTQTALDAIPQGLATYHESIARLARSLRPEQREQAVSFLTAAAVAASDAAAEMSGG
jgi:DNA-binding MarR family transcriptional regulator